MSSSPNELRPGDNKVVELAGRGDQRSERSGELLGNVRALALKRGHELVSTLLDNVDDALFDLAEKAESNAAQTQFFDGMREVRKRRPLLERLFGEQVARNFNEFAAGQPRARRNPALTRTGELSLVDDRDLEESLAIASMISKAEGRLNSPLHALNERLAVVCGGHKIDDANNPLGPASLARAFRIALRELEVDIRVRLIVLKLFERYVLAGLDALYHDINVQLMEAGVLPHLRHVIARAPSEPEESRRPVADAPSGSSASAPGSESAGLHAQLMRTLTALLASRRQARPAEDASDATEGNPAIASLTPAELLGALTLLQGEAASFSTREQAPQVDSEAAMGMVQRLKDELMAQIRRLSGEARAQVSGTDEDTIDLVGMLFEYILQDQTIPVPLRLLLARLQIPYVKVAILDRRMFAHASHPARQLLDLLAETAKGWSEESDRDGRLYDRIRGVVEALLGQFDDDIGVFERQLEDFETFVGSNRKRADLAEQRVAEAARGRERLQEARRRAAREIATRIEGHPLPALLQNVLTRPWANYLVLVLLRHGETSGEFQDALAFVDDFVRSAEPPADEQARTELREMLPVLETSLRHGLVTVAFQEPDLQQLFGELGDFWARQLGETTGPESGPSGAADTLLPVSAQVDPILEEDLEAPLELAVSVNDVESVQAVRALKVGSWIEFADQAGTRERAKLSWISPISGKYLFVNRRGLKVADRSLQQLAAEMRDGRAFALEEVPLFDRALDAIVERLRDGSAEKDA
ncbi:MAG TPA: DUF1631 domain-containing protein [Rhodanobacteraceae bacterium]|nr:DUF1631 domain-containing protein [Rhodanobacteraceae bacterium]